MVTGNRRPILKLGEGGLFRLAKKVEGVNRFSMMQAPIVYTPSLSNKTLAFFLFAFLNYPSRQEIIASDSVRICSHDC